ncbi:adenosylcobinamide-phosphate synthase CbiB [Celeribacter arenosi]|uniref:Cobalamin biosynthesis protein CobD n=1 Tax=Celeribacter arenosi TaxID=792649 RepID=A0ABP7JZE7_9RHOB
MNHAALLVFALLLDALLGEPKWLWDRVPHPAVLMGRLIGWADTRINTGTARRAKGVLLVITLIALGAFIGGALGQFPVLSVLGAAILLAHKSLVTHVRNVATALGVSLADGRAEVAMIVGRDTDGMDEAAVSRAAIESAAENFSDGVIAPAFWFLIAGLPGIVIYKMINTADSMIGYRTERHRDFGWAAARLDDLLNLIPARLTAALIAVSYGIVDFTRVRADARLHRSPNAGWPEAALSRVLGLALAGPRAYHGEMRDYPWVNAIGRKTARSTDIQLAVKALWRVWGVGFVIIALLALV